MTVGQRCAIQVSPSPRSDGAPGVRAVRRLFATGNLERRAPLREVGRGWLPRVLRLVAPAGGQPVGLGVLVYLQVDRGRPCVEGRFPPAARARSRRRRWRRRGASAWPPRSDAVPGRPACRRDRMRRTVEPSTRLGSVARRPSRARARAHSSSGPPPAGQPSDRGCARVHPRRPSRGRRRLRPYAPRFRSDRPDPARTRRMHPPPARR